MGNHLNWGGLTTDLRTTRAVQNNVNRSRYNEQFAATFVVWFRVRCYYYNYSDNNRSCIPDSVIITISSSRSNSSSSSIRKESRFRIRPRVKRHCQLTNFIERVLTTGTTLYYIIANSSNNSVASKYVWIRYRRLWNFSILIFGRDGCSG